MRYVGHEHRPALGRVEQRHLSLVVDLRRDAGAVRMDACGGSRSPGRWRSSSDTAVMRPSLVPDGGAMPTLPTITRRPRPPRASKYAASFALTEPSGFERWCPIGHMRIRFRSSSEPIGPRCEQVRER